MSGLSPGCAIAALNYVEVSPQDKRLIAGGNLSRLLATPDPQVIPTQAEGAVATAADAGQPLIDFNIFDLHPHLGPTIPSSFSATWTAEDILRSMDKIGIEQAYINSMLACIGSDMRQGNNEVTEVASRYPDRFVTFAVVNPRAKGAAEEVDRCVSLLGMVGVKLHPRLHITLLSDARCDPALRAAVRLGVPVMSHSARTEPFNDSAQLETVARKHPDLTLIMCHAGNDSPGVLESIELAKRCENIVRDVAGAGCWNTGMLELAVRELGADRFLFGADVTLFDQPCQLGYILYARLTDGEKRTILGETARRLIGLTKPSVADSPTPY